MVITCYRTGLTPDYARVPFNPNHFLVNIPASQQTVRGELPVGAERLTFTLNDINVFDYAVMVKNGKTWYYFLSPTRVTYGSIDYVATVDWMSTERPVLISGALIRGHDLVEHAQGVTPYNTAGIRFPVTPIPDEVKRVAQLDPKSTTQMTVAVELTALDTSTQLERSYIFCFPTTRNANQGIGSVVDDIGRDIAVLTRVDTLEVIEGNTSFIYELKTIDNCYVLPAAFVFAETLPDSYPDYDARLKAGDTNFSSGWLLPSYAFTAIVTRNPAIGNEDATQPRVTSYGNLTANVTPVLDHEINGECAFVYYGRGRNGAYLSFTLRYRETAIDLLPSLRIPANTTRISQTAQTRATERALTGIGTALSIASAASSGSITGLIGAGTRGISEAMYETRQPRASTTIANGAAFDSFIHYFGKGNWGHIPGVGVIERSCANADEINREMLSRGWAGNVPVANFAATERPTTSVRGSEYNCTWRQFTDAIIDTATLDPRAVRDITTTLQRGFYVVSTPSLTLPTPLYKVYPDE